MASKRLPNATAQELQAQLGRLRIERMLRKITLDRLALLTGIDRSELSRIESGYRPINERKAAAVAKVFQVDTKTILSWAPRVSTRRTEAA